MIESLPTTKRPGSVFWAGVFFWVAPFPIFGFHLFLVRRGIVDPLSFLFAGLLLCAALFWSLRPRSRATFYLGSIALVATVVRGALTARTQYLLRPQFPHILPQAIGSALLTAVFVLLACRYIFGLPSRRYFLLR